MRKKHGLLFGFVIMAIMAIITMAGCELPKDDEFPSDFQGTWYRADKTYTLTFTKNILKASNQDFYWNLESASDDRYDIKISIGGEQSTDWITIKLRNGKLVISDDYAYDSENNWNGTWTRQ